MIRSDTAANDVLLRTASIEGLAESGSGHDRAVDAVAGLPSFSELLDRYSEDHTRLAVTMTSGNRVMGTIGRIGADQLILTLDGCGDTMTIPVATIDQVVIAK